MKDKNIILIFIVTFMMILYSYYLNYITADNFVSTKVECDVSLSGSLLSEKIYGEISSYNVLVDSSDYTESEYDITIYNQEKFSLSNWTIELSVPEDAYIENCWNAQYEKMGTHLRLTPVLENSVIYKNNSHTIGIIMVTEDDYTPEEIKFIGFKYIDPIDTVSFIIITIAAVIWAALLIRYFVTRYNLKEYHEKQLNDEKIILQSMNTFINFIDAKDAYTRGHSRRVAMYAAEIASRMKMSAEEVQAVYYCGLLHDAGKISIPDAILNKPGALTDEERKTIQSHTVNGGKILEKFNSIKGIRESAMYHHERYDGTGYPEGLKGDAIPIYARIIGVADAYDAMSSNRVYRRHLNKDEIIEQMQSGSGTQFDPNIVKYMIDMINDGFVNIVKMETADEATDLDIKASMFAKI